MRRVLKTAVIAGTVLACGFAVASDPLAFTDLRVKYRGLASIPFTIVNRSPAPVTFLLDAEVKAGDEWSRWPYRLEDNAIEKGMPHTLAPGEKLSIEWRYSEARPTDVSLEEARRKLRPFHAHLRALVIDKDAVASLVTSKDFIVLPGGEE